MTGHCDVGLWAVLLVSCCCWVGFVRVQDTDREPERERDEWVNVQEGGYEVERRTTAPETVTRDWLKVGFFVFLSSLIFLFFYLFSVKCQTRLS